MITPLPQITTLARAGALDRAWGLFAEGGYLSASDDPAALAVKGRLLKDRGLLETGGARAFLLGEAAAAYGAADAIDPQPWLLLNVATLTALIGEQAEAEAIADRVLARIASGEAVAETPYFLAATRAEALLLKGDIAGADAALAEARGHDPDGWSDHATTLRQFRLILKAREADQSWLDRHRPPRSMHFAGHLGVDPEDCAALRAEIDVVLEADNVGFGYGALAAGADIVVAEALLARGGELHVVLPADAEEFARQSVAPYHPAWTPRYEACLAAAASITIAAKSRGPYEPLATDLAADRAMGAAALNARLLETQAIQLLVIDEGDGGPFGGGKHTARDGERWRSAMKAQRVLTAPRIGTVPPSSRVREGREDLALAALLHVRFEGIDRLDEGQFARALDSLVAPVRAAAAALPRGPEADLPCGNARLLRFADVASAAAFARALHALDPPEGAPALPLTIVAHWGLVHGEREQTLGPAIAGLLRILPATMAGSFILTEAFASALAVTTLPPGTHLALVGEAGEERLYGLAPMA
jgi:hypothetical protein